jgi:hypothetical protein
MLGNRILNKIVCPDTFSGFFIQARLTSGENIRFLVQGPPKKLKMPSKWFFSNKTSKSYPICLKFVSELKNISSNEI